MPTRGRLGGAGLEAGVTLMELMVVVAIVGILAAIAYPAYTQFVMQTNRTDATKTLQLAAQSLERCYSTNFTYAGCTISTGTVVNDGSVIVTPNLFYNITFAIPDAQDYTLTAVAVQAPQTTDNTCAQFTLASTGQQAAQDTSAVDQTKTCWGSN
ncbi:MAG TPA: type IV pilin protein [Steroidobacteraceae bacterium]|nr:type IV pilin protein [Steroidobacteraceae bacterium]